MLIRHPRQTPADLAHWQVLEEYDRAAAASLERPEAQARAALRDFVRAGPCYAGVSWGKDSTVLAHLVATETPHVPLVWVRVEPIANPDCRLVRDAFLARFPDALYHEIVVECRHDADGWHATGTLERGFRLAAKTWSGENALASRRRPLARHISGVRAEESGGRKIRMRNHGLTSTNTCAPIGWWTHEQVFAHLAVHGLPVHPAYACAMGGLLDRGRIRVSSLGGRRGDQFGRAEWERRYYGAELAALQSDGAATSQ